MLTLNCRVFRAIKEVTLRNFAKDNGFGNIWRKICDSFNANRACEKVDLETMGSEQLLFNV